MAQAGRTPRRGQLRLAVAPPRIDRPGRWALALAALWATVLLFLSTVAAFVAAAVVLAPIWIGRPPRGGRRRAPPVEAQIVPFRARRSMARPVIG